MRNYFVVLFLFVIQYSFAQNSQYQDSLILLSETLTDQNEKGKILNAIIWSYRRNVEVAEPFLDQYDEIANQLDSDVIRKRSYYLRGLIYRVAGKFIQSIESLKKCEKIARKEADEEMLANVTYQMGALYNAQARYKESFEVLLESLNLFEKSNDNASVALVLNVLAIGYKKIGNKAEAESTMLRALSIYESLQNEGGQADVLHNLGNYYAEINEFDTALEYYAKQEKLDKKANYQPGLAYLYEAVGNVFSKQDFHLKANLKLNAALEIWQKIEGKKQEASVLMKLGLNEAQLGRREDGRIKILKALDIAKNENDRENEQEAILALSHLAVEVDNYKNAYILYGQYNALKDSLRSEKVTTQINNLSASYEAEKKEREIELLKSENLLKDEQLSKKRIQQVQFAALILFLIGVIIMLNMYFIQRRKLGDAAHHREMNKKVSAIERLNGRISDLLDQKDKLELRPQQEINELLENQLTDKEYEVLTAIAQSNTNKEIAKAQFISENTVKFHLKNIFSKLDVNNRKEAVKKIASLIEN